MTTNAKQFIPKNPWTWATIASLKVKQFAEKNQWTWAAMASLIVWISIGVVSKGLSTTSLVQCVYNAAFLAIAALGQMIVISSGRGAIDLSIPGVITLAAYLSQLIIHDNELMVLPGVLIILAAGIAVGLLNSVLVVRLKLIPLIATMAVGYILDSGALLLNASMKVNKVYGSQILSWVAKEHILGVPVLIFVSLALAVVIWYLIQKITVGRSLMAMGQNYEAAYYAGIQVKKVEAGAYVLSSVLGAIAGLMLSVRTGGAYLAMGKPYLMDTIGAVVIGGTLISGGKASTFGTLIGCLFLALVTTLMQLIGIDPGTQRIIEGILIVALIVVGSKALRKE
jgi:ribose transport system permease protein